MTIAAKAMAEREVETTIAALRKSSEKSFAQAIDKELLRETVEAADYHYRKKLVAAELKIRLELEKNYVEPLLQVMTQCITRHGVSLLSWTSITWIRTESASAGNEINNRKTSLMIRMTSSLEESNTFYPK